MKLIAETAWHHEGDYGFTENLILRICEDSAADIVKLHITLDLDEYMNSDYSVYDVLKGWLFTESEWEKLISIVRESGKELMLLLNDTKAVDFAIDRLITQLKKHLEKLSGK